jgi:hypothetical protein
MSLRWAPLLRAAAPWAALAAIWAVLFWPAFTADEVFFFRDLLHNYLPMKWLQRQAYLAGELPLWNPHLYAGVPFAADVLSAPYYPLNALLLLPSFTLGFNLLVCVENLIAAWGAAFLARSRGVGAWGSVVSGVAYGLGNLLVWSTNAMHFLSAYAWLPFTVGAFSRWTATRDRRWLGGAAAFLTLQLLAGDPQSAYLAVGLCLMVSLFAERWRGRWRQAALAQWPAAAAAAVAGLCAAVVLWPAAELLRLSSRTEEVSLAASQTWSFHPLRLVELWLPAPFGTYFPAQTYWGWFAINAPYGTPYYLSLYFGAGCFLLAILGAAGAARRERALLLAAGALALLISFGKFTPLYGVLYRVLPVWSAFRYPERVLVVVVLIGAVLAGGGLERLRERPPPRWWLICAVALTALCAGTWALASAREAELAELFERWTGKRVTRDGIADLATAGSHAAGFLLVLSLAALAARRLRPSLLLPLVAAVSAADVVVSGARLVWLAPSELFFQPGLFGQAMPPPGEFRVDWDPSLRRVLVHTKAALPAAYLGRLGERASLKPNTAILEGHDYLGGYGSATPLWIHRAFIRLPRDVFYDWFSVRYFSTNVNMGEQWLKDHPGERRAAQYGPVMLIERPGAYPRQWLVYRAEGRDSEDAVLEALADKPDLRRVAFVAGAPPALGPEGGEEPRGEVRAGARTAQGMEYSVTTPAPALLVMNEGYWPGWRARVDGREAEVLRVNGGMRGVVVPAGEHRVELRYRPPSLWQGAAGSALGLVALAALARRGRRRERADGG